MRSKLARNPEPKGTIGDGCWDQNGNLRLHDRQSMQISMEFFQAMACTTSRFTRASSKRAETSLMQMSKESLQRAIAEANKKVGNFDVYNIYDTCNGDSSMDILRCTAHVCSRGGRGFELPVHTQLERGSAAQEADAAVEVTPSGGASSYSCGRSGAAAWKVKTSRHPSMLMRAARA